MPSFSANDGKSQVTSNRKARAFGTGIGIMLILLCAVLITVTLRLQAILATNDDVAGLRAEIRLDVGRVAATARLVNYELRRELPRAEQISRLQTKLNQETESLTDKFEILSNVGQNPPTLFPSERVENYGHVNWTLNDFANELSRLYSAGPDNHLYLSSSASRVNLAAVPTGNFLRDIDNVLIAVETLTNRAIRTALVVQIVTVVMIALLLLLTVRYLFFARENGTIRSYLIGTLNKR